MHPYLLETFAHDRVATIHHSAGARSNRHPRQRIGRMLVSAGLHLIGDDTPSHSGPIGG